MTASRLACLYMERGNPDEADALITEAMQADRRIWGPSDANWDVLEWAARATRLQGELEQARRYVDEALIGASEDLESGGHPLAGTTTLVESALIARDCGDLGRALEQLDEATRRLDGMGDAEVVSWIRAMTSTAQASIAVRQNDPTRALGFLSGLFEKPGEVVHLERVAAVDLAAIAFAQQGKAEQAARLLGTVDHERERTGLVVRPPDRALRESAIRDTQSVLGHGWDSAVAEGRAMTLDEGLAYAATQADGSGDTPVATHQIASETVSRP
jgi:hypothetical protein